MLLTMTLLALQPTPPSAATPPAPDPRLACAPVLNVTAAGPPPPVFHAQRMEVSPESRVFLSAHRCPRADGGYRVERRMTRSGDGERSELEWVPVSQCALLGGWIEGATRLNLPAPMLRPHRSTSGQISGTWFVLNAHLTAGNGSIMGIELQILEPPGAAPNALSQWFRDGERLFKTCRDQGHGGTGYAPRFRRPAR